VIGWLADPCSYLLHHLTPEETTILKDGEVTFQIHGGGHAMAIYEVSKDTTRNEIGQFLCAGTDPATISNPANHVCNLNAANANAGIWSPMGTATSSSWHRGTSRTRIPVTASGPSRDA